MSIGSLVIPSSETTISHRRNYSSVRDLGLTNISVTPVPGRHLQHSATTSQISAKTFYGAQLKNPYLCWREAAFHAPVQTLFSGLCHFIHFNFDPNLYYIWPASFNPFQTSIAPSGLSFSFLQSDIALLYPLFILPTVSNFMSVFIAMFFFTSAWCSHYISRMNCCRKQITFSIFLYLPPFVQAVNNL